MSKPTIIIVPGAWHNPHHYRTWTASLESHGYPVRCVTLLTAGAEDVKTNNNDDAAMIRKVIDSIDGPVVVAMHSYGGQCGSEAAYGAKNVIGLVYVAAFAFPKGSSLVADAPAHEVDWREIDMEKGIVLNIKPRTTFYHDVVSEEVCNDAIAGLKPQNLAAFTTPSENAAWPELPRIYLICTDDRTLAPSAQETMVEKAEKLAGPWIEVKRLHAGHSPWMSIPKEFEPWFESAVGKIVEEDKRRKGGKSD